MNIILHTLWLACALVLLAGCGGSSGPPEVAEEPADALAVSITSDAQAIQLAGRTINAVLAYDGAMSKLFVNILGAWLEDTARRADASASAPRIIIHGYSCERAGEADMTFEDADHSGSITPGDSAEFEGFGCKFNGAPWSFTGRLSLKLTGGTNTQAHLQSLAPGSAEFEFVAKSLNVGGKRRLSGSYGLKTVAKKRSVFSQSSGFPDMSVAAGTASLRMRQVSLHITSDGVLDALKGRIATTVDGLGDVDVALALKKSMKVEIGNDQRNVPQSGSVRLSLAGLRIATAFEPGGAAKLSVDNGADGDIERVVRATLAQLDKTLQRPAAP